MEPDSGNQPTFVKPEIATECQTSALSSLVLARLLSFLVSPLALLRFRLAMDAPHLVTQRATRTIVSAKTFKIINVELPVVHLAIGVTNKFMSSFL